MTYFRQYRQFQEGEHIVIGGDLSAGLGDYSCCQFFSKNRLDIPLVYQSPMIATEMTIDILPILEKIYDETKVKPLIAYERNNGGFFEMDRLSSLNRSNKFIVYNQSENTDNIQKLGIDTTSANRPVLLDNLKEAIDKQLIKIYDKPTIDELFSFVVVRTSSMVKAKAEVNAHDDLVMSLAIAYHLHITTPLVKLNDNNDDIMALNRRSRFEPPQERLRFYS